MSPRDRSSAGLGSGTSMSNDITQWLEELGLGGYAELFAENGIDLAVLPHITDAELRELGVSLGARRKIQLRLGGVADGRDEVASPEPDHSPADAERRQVTVKLGSMNMKVPFDEVTWYESL